MDMNAFFHGDNPTTFDYIVTYGTAVIGALLIVFTAANLTLLQQIILFLIALDILGGVVANVTRSTNVWYRQQSRRVGLIFILLHIIQPVVLIALLDNGNWAYAIGIYVYMLISTLLVERLNPEQQKPSAYALTMLGILLFSTLIPTVAALAWFAPAYLLKLIAGHAVNHYQSHYNHANPKHTL